jgi:predicted AlkP superfamily pyrophosphatase or phosphodiesterase
MLVRSFVLVVIGWMIPFFSPAQKDAPKLVVGIVVDQMCYDYLYRFYNQFGKDGFKRLMDKGTHFRNVTYNYVPTFTGPGHASIYTGTTPSNHGIVANDWYHRPYNREVNCVDDTTVQGLGTTGVDGLCSPHFLRANTITDQLKLTYPNAKVVGVSIKDRILFRVLITENNCRGG